MLTSPYPVLQKQSRIVMQSLNSAKVKGINDAEELTTQLKGRRKRFHKTRKKNADNQRIGLSAAFPSSPISKVGALPITRETRSVGGTPVCLRKGNANFCDKNKRLVQYSI